MLVALNKETYELEHAVVEINHQKNTLDIMPLAILGDKLLVLDCFMKTEDYDSFTNEYIIFDAKQQWEEGILI